MIARTKVEKVIGKTFADSLDETVFQSGNWIYTKRTLVDTIGCGNFIAASRLAKVLRKLGIDAPAKLRRMDPTSLARTKGIGAACIYVAMCILEANDMDILKWWNYTDESVKFSTFKAHAMRRASKRKQEVA